MDKHDSEKLGNVINNSCEEIKNDTVLENQTRRIEYINIYWDEWNM
ncbi:hypothetical protein P9E76_19780 [Schinkia azotoformans]|nr:hypothetical protein [Schinkia azotoformans]MEC1639852.1 hypothetical protein [Schinkia azotoformans]MEC1719762.1 hypothetical protein [Schinkia azotoformans]MEC1947249.1 hypothetical protein [Schinkia azotoformans]MED4352537.1 hypothetical protein [Schinkia azotoformans]MED4412670.1 hypothetical protein [Schinkia azotoformans]